MTISSHASCGLAFQFVHIHTSCPLPACHVMLYLCLWTMQNYSVSMCTCLHSLYVITPFKHVHSMGWVLCEHSILLSTCVQVSFPTKEPQFLDLCKEYSLGRPVHQPGRTPSLSEVWPSFLPASHTPCLSQSGQPAKEVHYVIHILTVIYVGVKQ